MRTTGKATDLITFSRSSGGTALRKIGYGSELVTNGTFDSDVSGWSIDTARGTISWQSGVLRVTNDQATGFPSAYQLISGLTVGKAYRMSSSVRGTNARLRVTSTAIDIYSASNITSASFVQDSVVFVATATTATVYAYCNEGGNTGNYAEFDNISVKEVLFDQGDLTLFNHPADIPRIEYDASGNVLGLLVEEARTNLFPNSEAIDVTLNSQQQVSVSDVSITEGVYQGTWRNITEDTSTNQHRLVSGGSINITPNVSYTFSALVKRTSGLRDVQFTLFNSGDSVVGNFSLSNETATTESTGSATAQSADIENLGNGVYLVSVTGIVSTTATSCFELVRLTDDGTETYTGDGTSSVAITAMQLEQGSFKTSYIPTSGSTATRAADVASIATSEFGYRDDEGSWVIESQVNADVNTTRLAVLTDGNSTSRILSAAGSSFQGFISDNGATVNITTGSFPVDTSTKLSFGWAENNSAISLDGSVVVEDLNCTIPTSITYMSIGSNYLKNPAGSASLHIKSIKYIPRRLTNDQLVEITS